MSSYDSRNSIQIKIDEMLVKYKGRQREVKLMADRYNEDDELYKQITILINDLNELKDHVDKKYNKGETHDKIN